MQGAKREKPKKKADVLVVCPAHVASGGPEALHQFTYNLNAFDGVNARLWYWGAKDDHPGPAEYERYKCEYVTELPNNYDGILVVPEIWANKILDYPDCKKAVWWLGVDAYAQWTPEDEQGAFLKDQSIIHIAQSAYAYDFLKKLRIKRLYKCIDLLNDDFYPEPWGDMERGDHVLYNPAKATPFMKKIIKACPDIAFRPITGMTRDEVIKAMRGSKLYIDFGEFPGRERLPREAVLCGCCIITSKLGAAAYDEDFAHPYKYESKDSHMWAIVRQIRYVLGHYDECRGDFDLFREMLKAESVSLQKQIKELIGVFNEV